MARIRTVKPALFTHEGLFDAEQESGLPLRFAYIGLWTCADREGRFKWRPRELKLAVLPYDATDFAKVLDALEAHGFIKKYTVGGETFGVIPAFATHQHVNLRESQSEIPAPPENPPETVKADASTCVHVGKGREGELGKEGEGDIVGQNPDAATLAAQEVLDHLNTRAGRRYTLAGGTSKHLRALFRGCKAADYAELSQACGLVIEYKCAEWLHDPGMSKFVRPETLFAPGHWESYVQDAWAWEQGGCVPFPHKNGKSPPASIRDTDGELTAQILARRGGS